ncbi:MAG TPA: hypothetical protein VK203_01405 [Nostocaceae cyanobacterium]|nr:hypothetical protein [Nostocaceae cyanobacterium]
MTRNGKNRLHSNSSVDTNNALNYWYLPIPKTYAKPKFHIGQTVFHRFEVPNKGETLYPVNIAGIVAGGGGFWQYMCRFEPHHPWFSKSEIDWLDEEDLEAM